ncbi:uncharacterized protein LOC109540696 [Dendroctonus ponderosae]|uniref:uncharacterized protein LOC109540696 n=1 Tax=Dendroctonus ponderosae TaxID=77166 RepID=UPI0020357768|nr:uncharacterized protein LOC109540696 [Dendroctonus ponderosae]KAH1028943.1 hypothetical protein HUJ05_002258 [Dendroctonus ponderosae]
MKTTLLLAVAIAVAAASPSGLYHQEYNYKTSSSSFKNNELQHKTEDQGYYSKAGDLEGRVKPKVSSNSEHSEYVNPNRRESGNAGYYDGNADLISHGNLLANSYGASVGGQVSSGYQSGSLGFGGSHYNDLESEGLAASNYQTGNKFSGSSFQAGSESSFESSNLRTIASRLQNDLRNELESALRLSRNYDVGLLESELHRNLTARLNEMLQERFGFQTIRGGQSYSLIDGGRLQASPNYNQAQLDQLQRQIESSLLETIRREQSYRSSQSRQQSVTSRNYDRYEVTTTYRPAVTYRPTVYRPVYPNLNSISQERYPNTQYGGSQYSEFESSRQVEFSQAPSATSVTTIATNVQNNLNNELNRLLESAQRQYFSENSRFSSVNTGQVLNNLKQELRQNLTYSLDEELRRHFGTQYEKNGHMFSTGETTQYNYNVADLENLRRQVETNLIEKLTRDFERAKQHWITIQQQQQQQRLQQQNYQTQQAQNEFSELNMGSSSNQQQYNQYTTSRYDSDYYRPTAASIVPIISQGIKGGHQYDLSSQSEFSSHGSSSNMAQLERQLQSDLSSQLQAALSQNVAHLGRYPSSSRGQAGFEEAYRRLSEELQRNLTQQLQSFVSGSSGYSSSYGSVNENQLAQLRSQLQNSLASQLQQGLQQSYSSSASFSASAGSSASAGAGAYSSSSGDYYRGTRGSGNGAEFFGSYMPMDQLRQPDDCQQGYAPFRAKRSYGYRSQPLGISSQTGVRYNSRGVYGGSSGYGQSQPLGQETDDSELMQPFQSSNLNTENLGQEIDDDDTQQIVVDPGFGQFPVSGNQRQREDLDDTQQVQVDHGFSSIGLGSQSSQSGYQGRNRPAQSSNQNQLEAIHQKPLQVAPIAVGQEEDDSDDTQQVEVDHGFSSIGLGSQGYQPGISRPRPTVQAPQAQVQVENDFSSIGLGGQRVATGYQGGIRPVQASNLNQRPLSQATAAGGSIPKQNEIGQLEDDSDDTQQVQVEHDFGSIGLGSQRVETGYQGSLRPAQGSSLSPKPFSQVTEAGSAANSLNPQRSDIGQVKDDSDDTQQAQVDNVFVGVGTGYQSSPRPALRPYPRGPERDFAPPDDQREVNWALAGQAPSENGPSANGEKDRNFGTVGSIEASHSHSQHSSRHHQYNHQSWYPRREYLRPQNVNYSPLQTNGSPQSPPKGEPLGPVAGTLDNKREATTPQALNPGNLGQERDYYDTDILGSPQSTPKVQPLGPVAGNLDNKREATTPQAVNPGNLGQESDYYDTGVQINQVFPSSPRPSLFGGSLQTPSTPRSIQGLQYGTQNNLPEPETVLPLESGTGGLSYRPRPQTQPHTLHVKLENITPEQFTLIAAIEEDFSPILQAAVNKETFNSQSTVSRYQQYQTSLAKLERELRRNLTDCFAGTLKANTEISGLNKYSNQVYSKFNFRKISDVKKYIEIKLVKKLRAQLQTVFGINVDSPSTSPSVETVGTFAQPNLIVPVQPLAPTSTNQLRPVNSVPVPTLPPAGYVNPIREPSTPVATVEPSIPPQLQSISASIESTLTNQIDEIIKNELPTSWFPSQVYSKTLESLRANITRECQNLLGDRRYAYLNIGQKDVTALEQYIESHVSRTLVEKFQKSGYYKDSFNFQMVQTQNGIGGLRPQTTPRNFLESEINSQAQQFEFVPLSKVPAVQSGSLVTSTQTSPFDLSTPLPQPTLPSASSSSPEDSLAAARRNSDQLIEALRALARKQQEESNTNPSPQYVQVKLENITPGQLDVINGIEGQLEEILTEEVANEYSSSTSSNDYATNYRLYQASQAKLEADVKKKLADCFEGRTNQEPQLEGLNKYSNLIHQKFEFHKIADVQKYLEIKLVKLVRELLKNVYHIEGATSDRRVVTLDNITPQQMQVIRKIEENVQRQVEQALESRIFTLRQSQLSQPAYKQSLAALQQEMVEQVSQKLEKYCEPGFPEYSELISTGLQPRKIYDLKRYLQIRLDNSVRSNIEIYTTRDTEVNAVAHTHYSSNTFSGSSGYGSTSHQERQSGYGAPATASNQRGVKGGRQSHPQPDVADAEYISPQTNAAAESVPEIAPEGPDATSTTPAPGWWARFGNKVKKIVGKS